MREKFQREEILCQLSFAVLSSPNLVASILWFAWIRNSGEAWLGGCGFHQALAGDKTAGLARNFSLQLVSQTLHVVSLHRLLRTSSQDRGL